MCLNKKCVHTKNVYYFYFKTIIFLNIRASSSVIFYFFFFRRKKMSPHVTSGVHQKITLTRYGLGPNTDVIVKNLNLYQLRILGSTSDSQFGKHVIKVAKDCGVLEFPHKMEPPYDGLNDLFEFHECITYITSDIPCFNPMDVANRIPSIQMTSMKFEPSYDEKALVTDLCEILGFRVCKKIK